MLEATLYGNELNTLGVIGRTKHDAVNSPSTKVTPLAPAAKARHEGQNPPPHTRSTFLAVNAR